jgi:hypothetical protein
MTEKFVSVVGQKREEVKRKSGTRESGNQADGASGTAVLGWKVSEHGQPNLLRGACRQFEQQR